MKKIFLIIICIVAVAVFAFFAFRPTYQSTDPRPVVRIGASLPLTGDLAALGQSVKAGLVMALSEIPADSRYRYEIIFEDDRYNMRKAITNTHRLISARRVNAILYMFDSSIVAAPILEKHRIPGMGCTWGAMPFIGMEYSFNHYSRPKAQVQAFIEMLQARNIKSVAAVMQNSASIVEMREYLEQFAPQNGIELSVTNVNFGVKDYRIDIERIRQQNPDIVMLQLLDPELGIFIKQANELNLNIPLTSIDEFAHIVDRSALEGSVFVTSLSGDDDFRARFAEHSNLTMKSCTANIYDNFKILVSIYESSDRKLTGTEVKDRLYQIRDFPSALGVNISVDEDGIIDSPLIRVRIENGQVVRE